MKNDKNEQLVVVTGGSGYIAVNIIALLIKEGYPVRTTLRTMSRQDEVQSMLNQAGVRNVSNLQFVQTDLTKAEGWDEAIEGATYVIHVASPTPVTRPDADQEMIDMAVDGVKHVMNAAKKAGVKRVVLTSASGAVLAGHGKSHPQLFTEKGWSNLDSPTIDAYQRSKTIAEREAWKFVNENGIELSTILPVTVMGPILGKDFSHSQLVIKNMLEGKIEKHLKLSFDVVDVRDLSVLHILAMKSQEASGQRFLATSSENISFKRVAQILIDSLGNKASRVKTAEIPNAVAKAAAVGNPTLHMATSLLGGNMGL
ncbi:NAD-dependent epimerase/dehydratase family protein [Lactococcus lactis]|uniref:NAD-dependent epimerase/dehydratase family protein n=1 Tax=Lactococcus lactis TaxID=1358 RepID=A0AAP4DV38_9LACT|nr:NAD-dependent epimerase/dehydratase family protein [Lactococcus lactis]MDG4977595.1 NAD-dependent epimerase/dehydratase family protein [Lactococcus lactis]